MNLIKSSPGVALLTNSGSTLTETGGLAINVKRSPMRLLTVLMPSMVTRNVSVRRFLEILMSIVSKMKKEQSQNRYRYQRLPLFAHKSILLQSQLLSQNLFQSLSLHPHQSQHLLQSLSQHQLQSLSHLLLLNPSHSLFQRIL